MNHQFVIEIVCLVGSSVVLVEGNSVIYQIYIFYVNVTALSQVAHQYLIFS